MATQTEPPTTVDAQAFNGQMTGLFARWGRLIYRHRKVALALTALFVVVAGVWGTTVFGKLSDGGFDKPGSESSQATAATEASFGHVTADVVVVYRAAIDQSFATAAGRSAIDERLANLPRSEVTSVASATTTGSSEFVSSDGSVTYAALSLKGVDDQARAEAYSKISDDLVVPGVTTLRGGAVPVNEDITEQVTKDIARAESLSFPILAVLLIIVFGSLASASLPLLVGGIAILGAFTTLNVIASFTDVSVFAVNIVIMLGLGLAIDYALFIVSRFREELQTGADTQTAIVHTMATAGRTVAFSGLTVAVSLAALLLFPMNFLRSMGYGGIAAVGVAMIAALTALPAMLAVMGQRVDALAVPWLSRRARQSHDPDQGAWARLARFVMRRPVAVMVATVALLLTLGAPFLHVAFGGVDARALPSGTESRSAGEVLSSTFPNASTVPMNVVVAGASAQSVAQFRTDIARLPGVTSAEVVGERNGTTLIDATTTFASGGAQARSLVDDVRALPAPDGAVVLVGGESARLVDLLGGLKDKIPWAALYLVLVTFVLLFLAFGSVVLPIKAIVMNVLSLTATFGVLVWAFQDGGLADALNFTTTGYLEATQPVLMFALAFGLSMDYEVFLLSRMREEWDRTGDNQLAVSRGLQRSGRIITSAALLFVVVVGAFATSGIVFISMIGVGLAVAVLIDATIVRALLVPATMRLLGRWNWWAPAPLARFWERYGIAESDQVREPVQAVRS